MQAILTQDLNGVERKWEGAVSYMRSGGLNPAAFTSWISPLVPHKFDETTFTLVAKNENIKKTVNDRYLGKISGAFKAVYGDEYDINILLETEISTEKETSEPVLDLKNSNIAPWFRFDTFVRGQCNEFAYSACKAVADNPGAVYNPLFIYGDVGLGKTHLIHSIGIAALQKNPDAKVMYTSSENIVNEFIVGIRSNKNEEFRQKYRYLDVLLVDDVQFLAGKPETQTEFFHLFNTLHNAGKQIVLTSDKHPVELKDLEDRLRSRFGSGLSVDIGSPDFETRSAILQKKAELKRLEIDREVIDYIAKHVQTNIRELESALITVTARAKLIGSPCTITFAEDALREILSQRESREIDVPYIQEVVSSFYGISTSDMRGRRRTADIIHARHIAMYLCRMLIDKPLKLIGKEFGGKDHTTIIHAVDKITLNMDKDKTLKRDIAELESKIRVQ